MKALLSSLGHTNLPVSRTPAPAAHPSQFLIIPVILCPSPTSFQFHISSAPQPNSHHLSFTSIYFPVLSCIIVCLLLTSPPQPHLIISTISLLLNSTPPCTPHKLHTCIRTHLPNSAAFQTCPRITLPNLSISLLLQSTPFPAEACHCLSISFVTLLFVTTLIWFPRRKKETHREAGDRLTVLRGDMCVMP